MKIVKFKNGRHDKNRLHEENVDFHKLALDIEASGYTKEALSIAIGRTKAHISSSMKRKSIGLNDLKDLCDVMEVDVSNYLISDEQNIQEEVYPYDKDNKDNDFFRRELISSLWDINCSLDWIGESLQILADEWTK